MTSERRGSTPPGGDGTSDRIVYVDRSEVRDGKLAELQAAMGELVDFVEANEPQILSYDVYFSHDDDGGTRMTVIHTHDDSASLEAHMEIAGPEFPPIGEFITLEAIDVYGRPEADLVQRLREKASSLGSGRVSVHEHHRGFDRSADDRSRDDSDLQAA